MVYFYCYRTLTNSSKKRIITQHNFKKDNWDLRVSQQTLINLAALSQGRLRSDETRNTFSTDNWSSSKNWEDFRETIISQVWSKSEKLNSSRCWLRDNYLKLALNDDFSHIMLESSRKYAHNRKNCFNGNFFFLLLISDGKSMIHGYTPLVWAGLG